MSAYTGKQGDLDSKFQVDKLEENLTEEMKALVLEGNPGALGEEGKWNSQYGTWLVHHTCC